MKRTLLLFNLFFFSISFAQTGINSQWTWMKGAEIYNNPGIAGAQGISAAYNNPGSRENAASWKDKSGNFWLFGGYGYDAVGYGHLNDLWEYSISSNQWTWIKGDSTSYANNFGVYGIRGTPGMNNNPGSRNGSVSWTDTSGNLWMFGGYGLPGVVGLDYLNDLWMYNIKTNEWTWVKGDFTTDVAGIYGTKGSASSSNKPGARLGSISWTDTSGKLWMFGGYGYDSSGTTGILNDLWKYDPVDSEWTWMNGDDTANAAGIYGSLGVSAIANKPGARQTSISWIDASDKLWLFGGLGNPTNSFEGDLNDLWKYDPVTNEWTWINGDSTTDAVGFYGAQGIATASNKPGARFESVSWVDAFGKMWIFGGEVLSDYSLNDLWKYDPDNNEWTWMKGDTTMNNNGVYGVQGSAAAGNKPGARWFSNAWTDNTGYLWLFGGYGYDNQGNYGFLNDLWKISDSSLLPVNLVNVDATTEQKNILVSWKTAQEINTAYFIVERSSDAQNFSDIGTVKASGNSAAVKTYSLLDEHLLPGKYFYRLKIFNNDGTYSYSKIVSAEIETDYSFIVYPIPVVDILHIQLTGINENSLLQLIDVNGRKIKEQQLSMGTSSVTMNVTDLPKGVYNLSLINSSGTRTQQFIKQ